MIVEIEYVDEADDRRALPEIVNTVDRQMALVEHRVDARHVHLKKIYK